MADSFINKLNESFTISNKDYTVFDIVDNSTGSSNFFTKKVSYETLTKKLSSDIIANVSKKLNEVQTNLNEASIEISKKLDKSGLSFSSNEKMTGVLLVDAALSASKLSHFQKDIDLHNNKAINVATPINDYDGVNKKYVDDIVNTISIPNIDDYLLRTGDIMYGNLLLNADPVLPNHAATKKYADSLYPVGKYLPLSGGSITGNLNVKTPTFSSHAVTKEYVDSIIPTNKFVPISGGTMTGYLSVYEPILLNHAATKKYVDERMPTGSFLYITGGSMTGPLSVTPPSLSNHAATKKYVDDLNPANFFIALSGGTMTGNLNVITPTSDNHAVTKKYVDDRSPKNVYLPLSGGIMTGLLGLQNVNFFVNTYNANNSTLNIVGDVVYINLNDNILGFNYSLPATSYTKQFILFVQQKGTTTKYNINTWQIGTKNIIWENNNFGIGVGPTITQTTDKIDIFKFMYINNNWYGFVIGQNF